MKYTALLVIMAALTLGFLTGCSSKKEFGGKTSDASDASVQAPGLHASIPCNDCYLRTCPFTIRDTKTNTVERDSKSQSPALKGKCLEPIDYVVPDQTGQLRAQLVDAFVTETGSKDLGPITLKEAGRDESNPIAKVPLYEPLLQGLNLCNGEDYPVTERERTRLRQAGMLSTLEGLRGKAMLVPGYWKQGRWQATNPRGQHVSTLACVTGVIAKCVHWGYVPGTTFQGGTDLGPYHRACVQAARALYTEDKEKPFTCMGTEFDIYDSLNIQHKSVAGFSFESLWSEAGLVCMARSRWAGCDQELQKANVSPSPGECTDPVKELGQDWQASTSQQRAARIAISSTPGMTAQRCPALLRPDEQCQASP